MSVPSNHEETLFDQALGMDVPEARDAFLREACGNDPVMLARLQGLLGAHDRAGKFLEHKALADAGSRRSDEADSPRSPQGPPPHVGGYETPAVGAPSERPGDRIGRYKLLEQIGEGGMGTVWMAEQEEPVRRRVALKVIKLGMDTRQVLARFEAERQALALMDHPNIARVFDGGATGHPLPSDGRGAGGEGIPESEISNLKSEIPKGRPYFVMELVRGLPITKYCDQAKLSTRQRLELFGQVCRAVQHAHQKGIIHRDLKPSNILVTVQDDRPVVKVIDFGIAKATEGRLTDKTLFTGFQQLIGTPAYMSPEQASLGSLDIDTRSDTYSLGVVLYELLTGHPPFDTKELLKSGYEAVLRTIREVDPPKPSTRLTDLVAAGVSRRTPGQPDKSADSRRRLQEVRGNLDWIVMKCLEKDRARRYETANALALDLERHLHDEPVLARPPSTGYRLRKFVRKHRGPVAAAAGFVVLLMAATALSVGLAMWANREKKQAETARQGEGAQRQAAESERNRATSAETQAKENERQARIAEAKAKESEAEARAVLKFFEDRVLMAARPEGQAGGLGRNVTIRSALDAAEPEIQNSFTNRPLVEASIRDAVGLTYAYLGDQSNAVSQIQRALALHLDLLGPNHRRTLLSMNNLATTYVDTRQVQAAIPLLEAALARGRTNFGSIEPLVLDTMNNLGAAYHKARRLDAARSLYEEALNLRKTLFPPEHPRTLVLMHNLAAIHRTEGRLLEAATLLEETLGLQNTALDPKDPAKLGTMSNLAATYVSLGQHEKALPLLEQVVSRSADTFGRDHTQTLIFMNNLAAVYAAMHRPREALDLNEEVLHFRQIKLGADHEDTLFSMLNAARAHRSMGEIQKALSLFEQRLALHLAKPDADPAETFRSLSELADACWQADQFGRPEKLLRNLLEQVRRNPGAESPRLGEALGMLGECLLRQGKFAEAEKLLRESVPILEKRQPGLSPTCNAQSLLGWALLTRKEFAEAELLLLKAHAGLTQRDAQRPSRSRAQLLHDTAERLAQLYEATGKQDLAAEWRAKAKVPAAAQP